MRASRKEMLVSLEALLAQGGYPCKLELDERTEMVKLTYGNGSSKTISVGGDSHAAMIVDIVEKGFLR